MSKLKKQNILQLRDGNGIRDEELRLTIEVWNKYFKEPILEIGSGEGRQYSPLKEKFSNVIPSDVNTERWDKNLGEIMELNAEKLPFDDNSIGLVYSSNVIEHIEDIELALKEMKRVLKPEGRIIHLVPTVTWKIFQLLGYYPAKIRDLIATAKLFKPFPNMVHGVSKNSVDEIFYFTETHWKNKFNEAGLQLEGTSNLVFYTPYRFCPEMLKFRRLLASYGFVSCRAYLLSKLV
jgi:SAM-dependent methyltransferase